ncbi:hypothetical protein U370_03130 [Anaplasma marginale str. Dawn]|nr:hypothetical protein U370_03130 [Anaplasma marginale str. Dawn]
MSMLSVLFAGWNDIRVVPCTIFVYVRCCLPLGFGAECCVQFK